MNERLIELYRMSNKPWIVKDPSNNMPVESFYFSAEKFAELIVKECIEEISKHSCETIYDPDVTMKDSVAESYKMGYNSAIEQVVENLREHFNINGE